MSSTLPYFDLEDVIIAGRAPPPPPGCHSCGAACKACLTEIIRGGGLAAEAAQEAIEDAEVDKMVEARKTSEARITAGMTPEMLAQRHAHFDELTIDHMRRRKLRWEEARGEAVYERACMAEFVKETHRIDREDAANFFAKKKEGTTILVQGRSGSSVTSFDDRRAAYRFLMRYSARHGVEGVDWASAVAGIPYALAQGPTATPRDLTGLRMADLRMLGAQADIVPQITIFRKDHLYVNNNTGNTYALESDGSVTRRDRDSVSRMRAAYVLSFSPW